MGLEKVTYVDGTTVITAQNLNAIQDSIIDLEASRTVPSNVRNAIYTLLENAAYATTGLEDEIAVVEAWAEEVTSLTLSVSTLSLDSDDPQAITATTVPIGATVTWSSSNNSVATVSDGIVTGVSNGSCVITASAGELVATCDVTVEGFAVLESISAVYTQSGTVYNTDSIDSLKADLVVTATYSDSSTETIPSTDYTLSGTLTVGTSTITVVYGGKSTTFNVTVSDSYSRDALTGVTWLEGYTYNANTGLLTEAAGEYCTEKFTVQDAMYQYIFSNSGDSYTALFVWDADGNYYGRQQENGKTSIIYQLKPNYRYAIKTYNTSDFDASNVSMMPIDNRSTEVANFSISLVDNVESIATTSSSGIFELNVTSAFQQAGITSSSLGGKINRFSECGAPSAVRTLGINLPFQVGIIYWSGNWFLQLRGRNLSTLAKIKQYITDNNIVLEFNY